METYDLADTLAQVNVLREAFGHSPLYELPQARTGNTKSCLFFRALKDVGCTAVGDTTVKFNSERAAQLAAELWGTSCTGNTVHQPSQMKRVVHNFDQHNLPHYETQGNEYREESQY